MNQKEFVKYISQNLPFSKEEAETIVHAFTNSVWLAMSEGHNIKLPNFGTFSAATIPSRQVVVPKINKLVTTRKYRQPYFKPALDLRIACN